MQRFGRVNRYGERNATGGGAIHLIDLCTDDENTAKALAVPYEANALRAARDQLATLADACPANDARPANLRDAGVLAPARRVIRWKDMIDLFDTDPDLTGFDVDVSPYIRDAEDTDITLFWRDLGVAVENQPPPQAAEICAAPIGRARPWINTLRKTRGMVWRPDPQVAGGWAPLDTSPWPGMALMLDMRAGGYDPARGFDPQVKGAVQPVVLAQGEAGEDVGADPLAALGRAVTLADHTDHVVAELLMLLAALDVGDPFGAALTRAARWHDVGKAHPVFQDTMRKGLAAPEMHGDALLAKTEKRARHARKGFRHELASALAWLEAQGWAREADLGAYLIAAHHGKVRLSLRAWPGEAAPADGGRFARGVHEGDALPPVELGGGEVWVGGSLRLSIMEIGRDDMTGESWTERSQTLLAELGPFRLAWAEALLRIADQRASTKEAADG